MYVPADFCLYRSYELGWNRGNDKISPLGRQDQGVFLFEEGEVYSEDKRKEFFGYDPGVIGVFIGDNWLYIIKEDIYDKINTERRLCPGN